MTTASPEGPLHRLTQSEMAGMGFSIGQPNELYVYVELGFADDVSAEAVEAAIGSATDLATIKRSEERSWCPAQWAITVKKELGLNRDAEALLSALYARTSTVLAQLESAGLATTTLILRYVHHLDTEYQGHGLGVPAEWVSLVARYNGFVDIDQYVVSLEAPASTKEAGVLASGN